jgi:hypothetical protein
VTIQIATPEPVIISNTEATPAPTALASTSVTSKPE